MTPLGKNVGKMKSRTKERWQVIVNGGSMRPFLRHGQRLMVERVESERLRAGDIVLFRRRDADKPRIHRIRRILQTADGEKLLIRGDNLGRFDGIFGLECVEGLAVKHVRSGMAVKITRLELDLGLLLAPLIFRARELTIFILALLVRFMYPFSKLEIARYADAGGRICLVYSWHGRPVCRYYNSGRTWVHPLFAKTPVLKQIMSETE